MRLFPIITAIVVVAALYLLIFERDRVLDFAGTEEVAATVVEETEEAPPEAEQSNAVAVVAYKSEAKTIDGAVILRGRTEAARQVELRSETSGQIISEPLRKGAFVEANELLCQLDSGTRNISLSDADARLREAAARIPEAEARLAEARARLIEAEINDNAAARLSEDGFASETRVAQTTAAVEAARAGVQAAETGVESARAGVQSAEAGVASARNELEKLEIRAPFSGILETDTAEIGSLLQPGSLCATVIQLNPVKLVAFVPETEVNRISLGAPARARLAAGGLEVTGTVNFLSRSADETTRTFRVEIEVANPDLTIRDGQTTEIAISSAGARAHLLPPSALTLNEEGLLGLRTVTEDGMVEFAPVTVMRDTTQGIWLTGLPDTANVIVVGQEFVTAGVKVAPTYQEQTQ